MRQKFTKNNSIFSLQRFGGIPFLWLFDFVDRFDLLINVNVKKNNEKLNFNWAWFLRRIIEEKIHQINENTTADFIWTVYNSGKYLYKIKKPFLYEIKINNTAIAEVL